MKFIDYNGMQVPINPPLREKMGVVLGMRPTDYVAGVSSPIVYEVTRPDWDWRPLIFAPDNQFYPTFDTWACTNFSPSNSRKLQLKNSTGEEYNFSERASAYLSGTRPGSGNYMTADPDSARKNGVFLNKDWPNEADTDSVMNWFKPLPLEVLRKAIRFDEKYEWIDVTRESIKQNLKQAPVTIAIRAGSTVHDVCVVFVDDNGLWYFDSYPHETIENHLAITTQVPLAALKIITKAMNTIYFVHRKGTGEYGLLSVSPVGQQYVPASTEADLKARGGTAVPLVDGKVDYSKAVEIDLPL